MILNIDFLAGTLCGCFMIRPLVLRLSTGRWDGWIKARECKPPVGEPVLACAPGRDVGCVIYRGPHVDGDIPESANLYWRPMPERPIFTQEELRS